MNLLNLTIDFYQKLPTITPMNLNSFADGLDARNFDDLEGRNTPCPYELGSEDSKSWIEGYHWIDREEYVEELKMMEWPLDEIREVN